MKREDIVGVYRQLGEEVVDAAGKMIHSDNNRSSQLMYSADGYVGAVSTPSGRKKTSAPAGRTDLVGSTPEELVEAPDIGPIVAEGIRDFFAEKQNRELVERLRKISPAIRVLCTSGYVPPPAQTDDSAYLQKPFTSQELILKVQQTLVE